MNCGAKLLALSTVALALGVLLVTVIVTKDGIRQELPRREAASKREEKSLPLSWPWELPDHQLENRKKWQYYFDTKSKREEWRWYQFQSPEEKRRLVPAWWRLELEEPRKVPRKQDGWQR